jgi:hypothetical protein
MGKHGLINMELQRLISGEETCYEVNNMGRMD